MDAAAPYHIDGADCLHERYTTFNLHDTRHQMVGALCCCHVCLCASHPRLPRRQAFRPCFHRSPLHHARFCSQHSPCSRRKKQVCTRQYKKTQKLNDKHHTSTHRHSSVHRHGDVHLLCLFFLHRFPFRLHAPPQTKRGKQVPSISHSVPGLS